jgi:hypothetical protein
MLGDYNASEQVTVQFLSINRRETTEKTLLFCRNKNKILLFNFILIQIYTCLKNRTFSLILRLTEPH